MSLPVVQVLLSTEDLRMMIDEVSGRKGIGNETGTVNLKTFLQIMEKSSW
jgi:hypothetical protein